MDEYFFLNWCNNQKQCAIFKVCKSYWLELVKSILLHFLGNVILGKFYFPNNKMYLLYVYVKHQRVAGAQLTLIPYLAPHIVEYIL